MKFTKLKAFLEKRLTNPLSIKKELLKVFWIDPVPETPLYQYYLVRPSVAE